ncbi:MAG: beta-lactamase family protein [Muribaculaceae bacterium]|nr:beta-lactamase family protein [Muribaculaceae bacterium]
MTRGDIKRGTLCTILFSIVAYAVIFLIYNHQTSCTREEETVVAQKGPEVIWTDTLTNHSSEWKALQPMDGEIERFMDKWHIKGLSFAVTRHDSLLYAKGYGYADAEIGRKLESADIMRIASASKLVTAIAVMKLVEQGKLTLDTKIFGPEGILNDTAYTNAMCDKRMLDITVDHLLRHMGGFGRGAGDPMFTTNEIIKAKNLKSAPTPEELVKIVLGRRIAFAPGNGRIYSNFGYMLLSMAMERVTGMSYWDYVTKNVLEPAGCHTFRPATNYYEERHPNESKYYAPDDELVEEYNGSGRMVSRVYGGNDVNALKGAGGWCTSAADFARLVAAADGDPALQDVISRNSVATLTAYSEDEKLSRGWSECDATGKWTRTGTLSSTHTLVERFPDGDCWVIITNSGIWTGFHFTKDLVRLLERLRSRYSDSLPKRDLF